MTREDLSTPSPREEPEGTGGKPSETVQVFPFSRLVYLKKSLNNQKLSNILLNNPQVKKEIIMEIRKYFKPIEMDK